MLVRTYSKGYIHDPRDKTIGNTVTEWNESHYDERRNRIADISPVDSRYLTNHHAPDLHDIISQFPTYEKQSSQN